MNRYAKSVVIPTYNEVDNIVVLLSRLESLFGDEVELLVVDDHSPDGTFEAARACGEGLDHVRCFLNDGERGLSPSVLHGFDRARGERLACMDGDLQHDENCLARLFRSSSSGKRLVIGSRYVPGGSIEGDWGTARRGMSLAATWLTRLALGLEVRDPMSGFFVVDRESYLGVRGNLNPHGFKIMLYILFWVSRREGPGVVSEVGINFRRRLHGRSKLSAVVVLQFFRMLLDLRRAARFEGVSGRT